MTISCQRNQITISNFHIGPNSRYYIYIRISNTHNWNRKNLGWIMDKEHRLLECIFNLICRRNSDCARRCVCTTTQLSNCDPFCSPLNTFSSDKKRTHGHLHHECCQWKTSISVVRLLHRVLGNFISLKIDFNHDLFMQRPACLILSINGESTQSIKLWAYTLRTDQRFHAIYKWTQNERKFELPHWPLEL